MHQDLQHLRLLSIFHYIVGGLVMAVASIFLFHFGVGLMMLVAPASMTGPSPPAALGWLFVLLGGGAVFLGWAIGIALMLAGRFLGQRRHYIYCLVMACIALLFQPFGTILGVFTLIVLLRPSVKRLYETGEAPYDPEEDEDAMDASSDHIMARSYNRYRER